MKSTALKWVVPTPAALLTAFLAVIASGCASAPIPLVPGAGAMVDEPEAIEAGRRSTVTGPYSPGVDVTRYDIEVVLPETGDRIAARTRVELERSSPDLELWLDLTGLAVTNVTVDDQEAIFRQAAGRLWVTMPPDSGRHAVEVWYRGTPDDGLIIDQTLHGRRSAFVDNWPNRARFWFPSIDHPSDKAAVSFTVHAPSAWRVIANGALLEGPAPTAPSSFTALGAAVLPGYSTTRWATAVDIPTYTMVVGATEMDVQVVGEAACGSAPVTERGDGCVEVTNWVFPEDAEKASAVFGRADEIVDFFTRTIGPFPYEKLANVQSSTRFGGMENASAIFYTQQGVARGLSMEGTVSHEIAHQWFGDAITEGEWSELWLSEGFATYFGHLFFESADGVEVFRERLEGARLSVVQSDVSRRPVIEDLDNLFDLLNTNNYPKGGWVLHMLRGVIGDEAFFAGIRTYYRQFAHGNALTDDFRRVMEEASAQDLRGFFEQWLEKPGFPVFEVLWETGSGEVTVTLRQIQDGAWPVYRMPVTVEVVTDAGSIRAETTLQGRSTQLTLPVSGVVTSVIVDPDGWLLKDVR